ncbi:MAG: MgtC/SapB family protein [Anaerolineales bacterium]|nr:MgtC/SapB family protein [Anaerolineales bacterium]
MFIFTPEDLIKLACAVLVGGVIGMEREVHAKAAGLRTITLITIGATLFTILSTRFQDADRVAANIVTGIGFLGAGAILFAEGKVKGLTTASSIWAAAAMGMAIGRGEYLLAGAATLIVVVVLVIFARLDRLIDHFGRETRTYEIVFPLREEKYQELETFFYQCRMRIRTHKRLKQRDALVGVWDLEARARDHICLADTLLADKEIIELTY